MAHMEPGLQHVLDVDPAVVRSRLSALSPRNCVLLFWERFLLRSGGSDCEPLFALLDTSLYGPWLRGADLESVAVAPIKKKDC